MNDKDKAVIKAVITIKDHCINHGCDCCIIESFCNRNFTPTRPIPAVWDTDMVEEGRQNDK